jgi:hypothetical protein
MHRFGFQSHYAGKEAQQVEMGDAACSIRDWVVFTGTLQACIYSQTLTASE